MLYGYAGVAWGMPPAGGAAARGGDEALWPESVGWPEWRWKRRALRAVSAFHRAAYRATGGRLARFMRGGEVMLLTTTGRKTRRARTWPLCFLSSGDDIVVVASAAGAERHPGWYLNLRDNPNVQVQVGGSSRAMVARTAEGFDRARLWERLVGKYPVLERYQRQVERAFPVVILEPVPARLGGM